MASPLAGAIMHGQLIIKLAKTHRTLSDPAPLAGALSWLWLCATLALLNCTLALAMGVVAGALLCNGFSSAQLFTCTSPAAHWASLAVHPPSKSTGCWSVPGACTAIDLSLTSALLGLVGKNI